MTIPHGAFALAQNPDDPLYKRCDDSLCAHCGLPIEGCAFQLVFSEHYAYDVVVHHQCADDFLAEDETRPINPRE